MRILVASDQWFPDFKGGSARVATDTAAALARRGHTVTAIVPHWHRSAILVEEPGLTVLRVLPQTRWPSSLTDVLSTTREARQLRDERFDVLLGHQSSTTMGLWAARLQAPLVSVFHASAARELRFLRQRLPPGYGRLKTYPLGLYVATLERFVARGAADKVLVLSQFSRALLGEDHGAHGKRAEIVPAGVDVASFTPKGGQKGARARLGIPAHDRLLLTVRRFEPRMGLEQLLQALALLHLKDLKLAVVGGGILAPDLYRLAEDLGVSQSVHFAGRVPDQELHDWYRAADLFVLPTVAYEGFGMATAEALASGTPVIGTPVGATPELLTPLEPRLVARGTDADALASAISGGLELVDDAFRRRCRAYACSRFSLERTIVEWEKALLEVVRSDESLRSTRKEHT